MRRIFGYALDVTTDDRLAHAAALTAVVDEFHKRFEALSGANQHDQAIQWQVPTSMLLHQNYCD